MVSGLTEDSRSTASRESPGMPANSKSVRNDAGFLALEPLDRLRLPAKVALVAVERFEAARSISGIRDLQRELPGGDQARRTSTSGCRSARSAGMRVPATVTVVRRTDA